MNDFAIQLFCIFLKANTFSKPECKKLHFLISNFQKLLLSCEFSSYLAGLFLPVSAYTNEVKCKQ